MNATLLGLLGGVALLLYGIQLVGDGLQRAAGGRMRQILSALTGNRLVGVGAGIFITLVLQSSGATVGMLVRFAGAGVMQALEAMGFILGADIGTTLVVQLIAFKISNYALLLIGVGFFVTFVGQRKIYKYLGQAVLGFGFIFYAIHLMSGAMTPLRESPLFQASLLAMGDQPLLGILVSTVFTALVASSAATLGIAITLAHAGLLPLPAAIPIIFGANIGTCSTSLASSVGGNAEAKRVALAHILFKVVGVLIFLPFVQPFARLVEMTAETGARQIANAHTLFNVGIAVLFLPFTPWGASLMKKLVPEGRQAEGRFQPRYLDERFLDTPAVALGQATREALRMADIVSDMLRRTIEPFSHDDQDLVEYIEKKDDQADILEREIRHYLTKISQQSLTDEQSRREVSILSFVNNLENIGDIVERNLMELAKKKIYKGVHFSEPGFQEIQELHKRVSHNLELAISTFASNDPALAQQVLDQKMEVSQMERRYRQSHIQRLHDGYKESIETSEIHLDVLTNLKRVNSHVTAIAYPVLEEN